MRENIFASSACLYSTWAWVRAEEISSPVFERASLMNENRSASSAFLYSASLSLSCFVSAWIGSSEVVSNMLEKLE